MTCATRPKQGARTLEVTPACMSIGGLLPANTLFPRALFISRIPVARLDQRGLVADWSLVRRPILLGPPRASESVQSPIFVSGECLNEEVHMYTSPWLHVSFECSLSATQVRNQLDTGARSRATGLFVRTKNYIEESYRHAVAFLFLACPELGRAACTQARARFTRDATIAAHARSPQESYPSAAVRVGSRVLGASVPLSLRTGQRFFCFPSFHL